MIRIFNKETNACEYLAKGILDPNCMVEIPNDGKPYGLKDGEVICLEDDTGYLAQQLEIKKAEKLAENAKAREVEYISITKGKLKTVTPLGDLKAAIPLYEKLVKVQGGLPADSVRFYDADGNAFGNEAMTADEFGDVVLEVAMGYIGIDKKSTVYTQAIISAKSIEALNKIVLDYSGV